MRVAMFYHSLLSEWNHGNAHFLRGIVTELVAQGHDVHVLEPEDSWSYLNMVNDHGEEPVRNFRKVYPGIESTRYNTAQLDLETVLDGVDLVLVHEWNEAELVSRIGKHRARSGRYCLLFHDTHHRSVTDPQSMTRYDLGSYDGVLAFGESVSDQYRRRGWGRRVWTWHEAADVRVFHPLPAHADKGDLVWIGNWGDDERTAELKEFLIEPVRDLGLRALVHGVRYPEHAISDLRNAGIYYGGWLPNFEAPQVFARFKLTIHVPRRPYATALPGVPTIRIFEALACGMPLISAPWEDSEHLFVPGADFLFARNGSEMKAHLEALLSDPEAAAALGVHGRRTIIERHTCGHRVAELLDIYRELQTEAGAATCLGARGNRC